MTKTYIYYRLAGILFVLGGLIAIPPDLLIEQVPRTVLLLPLLAVVTGIVCWVISRRAPAWGLNVVCAVASLEVAATVALVSPIFAAYYVLVAIFTAYALSDPREIVLQVSFLVCVAAASLFYGYDSYRQTVSLGLVLLPVLVVVAGMVGYLRERLAASQARYRALSERDPLTGVGNYRMLTERVSREVLRHLRHDRELALLAIDLDRFKQVNDEHGHHRGDEVLREVAATLLQNVRTHDIVVRHGGDEFAVVATETEPDEAMALAERLRDAICELSPDGMELGASIDVAHFPHDARTLDGLLVVADRNLRDVKADGRNAYRSRQLSRAII